MATSFFTIVRRVAVGAWQALDFTRRALLNAIVLLLLLALVWGLVRPGPGALADKTTLVLDLEGPLREQFAGSVRDSALRQARGQEQHQTRLRDLLAALEAAQTDPAITRVLVLTDGFGGAGPASLHEVALALQRFRASGKPVWAWAEGYTQAAYYIAAHADRVLLHPMGQLRLEGYGGHRMYWRDALERAGVTAHVLRAGTFKSAGETWVANGPSPETDTADRTVYDALWGLYTQGVETARKLPAGSVMALIDALPDRLKAAGGDVAALALQSRLVDDLKTRDQVRTLLMEGGAADSGGKSFRQVALGEYLARIKDGRGSALVGVVIAEGTIHDGQASPGAVGGDSTSTLIRRAREDDRIKALVLRVDSPGGSAFASELIRRELELTRAAGKPVVVSMGDLAASGGFWISLAADEVIADPATITGSIGVITMFPGFDKALDNLGLHTAGYTTTWLAGAMDPRRPLDPRLEQVLQAGIDHVYADFTGRVAAARKRPLAEIDAVAQGRIWTGAQAKERGLVDRTGHFGDAIDSAAKRAKLADDSWSLTYIEAEPGRIDRLLGLLSARVAQALADSAPQADTLALLRGLVPDAVTADASALAGLMTPGRPSAPLAHCLCGLP
jgi:protease-4